MKKALPLLVLCFALLLSGFILRPSADGYKVGDKAADFKLKNTNGKLVSLADNKAAKGYIAVSYTHLTLPTN